MLSGDVEPNPGPPIEEALKEILDGQKNIQDRLEAIETKLKNVEECTAVIKQFHNKFSQLENSIKALENQMVDLEDRSRRNNLIVFGLPEVVNETAEGLAKSVIEDLFQKTLDVTVCSIERMHRLGRKTAHRPRPVIMRFMDHREKLAVLINCPKLKGEGGHIRIRGLFGHYPANKKAALG